MSILSHFSLSPLYTLIFFISCGLLLPSSNAILNHNALIYKYCATRRFSDLNGSYSRSLSTLFQELLTRSSQSKFYSSVVKGDNDSGLPLSGHFQCGRDLNNQECYDCVRGISSNTMCADSVAARIQLSGCHLQYEFDGPDVSSPGFTYKVCDESHAVPYGFEEMRNAAFEALESGVGSDTKGSYAINYGSFLSRLSVKLVYEGQVFMDVCFFSYECGPNDILNRTNTEKKSSKQNSGKLIAITVGSAALVAIALVYFRFLRSYKKGNDDV
ncbi:hypothetical protein Nepgr_009497 [Nepenthes gracilis]|uniref:Gnk2-homologous domain-containing protein n=1 Tax=Nepenthes gracilis TaxID=150966 RepID=A0AAD3SAX9_NEPGR|nr:hypothetical protein Nepgr_009497 [Nepenthes gracilis]